MNAVLRDVWVENAGPRSIGYDEFERRFWARAQRAGACLLWTATRRGEYGAVSLFRRMECAHRVAYWMAHGPLLDGMEIDHMCDTPLCVEPTHLRQVHPLVNWARSSTVTAINARKTHCDHGHEFTPENTRITSRGRRDCRACNRARAKRDYYRAKEAS